MSPTKTVVLIGASIRAAAQSARRAGFQVVGIDLFGDQDCRDACQRYAMLDQTDDAAKMLNEYPSAPVVCVGGFADPASVLRSLGPHADRIETMLRWQHRLKQPETLRELAIASGLSIPETITEFSCKLGRQRFSSGRWLVKPRSGSGGIGVQWFDGDVSRLGQSLSIQRYVAGRVHGATLAIDANATAVVAVCRSLIHRHGQGDAAMPFLYAGSFGPVPISGALRHSLTRIGNSIHQQTGLVGLCNVDVVVERDGKTWLLEINPRWSGSSEVIERSLIGDETSLFMIGCDPGRASLLTIEPMRQTYKRILYAPRHTGTVKFQLRSIAPEISDRVQVADIPADGTVIEPGWPICSVLMDVNAGDVGRSVAAVRTIRDRIIHASDYSSFSSANDLMR